MTEYCIYFWNRLGATGDRIREDHAGERNGVKGGSAELPSELTEFLRRGGRMIIRDRRNVGHHEVKVL